MTSPVGFSVRCMAVLGLWAGNAAAEAADIQLGEHSVLRFAGVREGAEALTRRDEYIAQLSPFDRQVRMRTDRAVSEGELLAFIAGNVVPWQPAEIEMLTPLLKAMGEKVAPWKLKLPPVVLLVKTTGREEADAAYCRGAAIVLPQTMVANRRNELVKVLPHELFHVLSSHNPGLRQALYASIGFQPCNEVKLPEPLAERKITNPDAPVNNHYITVRQDGHDIELMPVLFSKSDRYDPARGGGIFSYLQFKLMQLTSEGGVRQPAIVGGQPVLLDAATVPGYAEQVGTNTKYIIHPEEILADNFAFLLSGRIDLPSPRVVQEMGRILQDAAREP
jgi:hypothetical protein